MLTVLILQYIIIRILLFTLLLLRYKLIIPRRLTIAMFQTGVHDVSQAVDEKLEHDSKVAAPRDIQL